MSDFIYQEGLPLDWSDMNYNLRQMQAKYLDSASSASIAIAAANFKGNWTALTGPLAVPAAVYHSSKFWLLLSNLADVTAATPGVSGSWLEIITGNVMGPASATDNAVARFDGATGKLVQNSGATLSDAGELALPANGLAVGGTQLAVSSGVANFGIRSSWALGAVTTSAIAVSVTGTGTGRTLVDLANADTTTSNAASLVIKSGASTSSLELTKYGTEYTVISAYAGLGALIDRGSAGIGLIATDAAAGIKFMTGAATSPRAQITAAGNLEIPGPGTFGYAAGAGGTVTQATSKSTNVTLNKQSGRITMNAAALAAGASVSFYVLNTYCNTNDMVTVVGMWGAVAPMNYRIECDHTGNGQFGIRVTNITGASRSEAVQINFFIEKVAVS